MWKYQVTKTVQTKHGPRIEARVWEVGAKAGQRAAPKTKRFALKKDLHDFIDRLNSGAEVQKRGSAWMTVQETYNSYLGLSTNTESYLNEVKLFWKTLGPMVGALSADKITKLALRTLERDLKKLPPRLSKRGKEFAPPSQRTINMKVGFIRTLINFAHENGLIPHNPIGAKFTLTKAEETFSEFWDISEATEFLRWAEIKYPPGSPKRWVYVLYLLAINTGMRAAEMWALQPLALRAGAAQLMVLRQWVGKKEKRFRHTKGKAKRAVPLNDELIHELGLLALTRPSTALFFPSSTGTPMDHKNFSERYFQPDVLASGVRRIKFHGMRGTAATIFLSLGHNVVVVQTILGHKSLAVTMKYVRALAADISAVGRTVSITGRQANGAAVTPIAGRKPKIL